jgi:hypothetical protein
MSETYYILQIQDSDGDWVAFDYVRHDTLEAAVADRDEQQAAWSAVRYRVLEVTETPR